MNTNILLSLLIVVCCLIVYPSYAADTKTTIYQTQFSDDSGWTTNNPSNNKLNTTMGRYQFSIEPSTNSYAYVKVLVNKSFTLEYDVNITKMDEGATFRMGLADYHMDINRGPIALTMFNTGKYGNLMSLRIVSPGNFLQEINSQGGAIGVDNAYMGNTARFSLNKTYRVTLSFNQDTHIMTMKVADFSLGKEVWGYFIKVSDNMNGLDRVYMGSVGDYGQSNVYATGYIDNVVVSTGLNVISTPTPIITKITTLPTPVITTRRPTVVKTPTKTPIPATTTPKSSIWVGLPLIAVGYMVYLHKK